MDPVVATIVVAVVTAASGLISGLVVAYAKPFAEDRALAGRERRAERRRILNLIHDMLLSPNHQVRAALPSAAASIGDPRLTECIDGYLRSDPDTNDAHDWLEAARVRVGELIGQV